MLARVGAEVITAGDLLAGLDMLVRKSRAQLPPEQIDAQRDALRQELERAITELAQSGGGGGATAPSGQQRRAMLEQILKQQIETKLVYHDARQKIPHENFPNVESQIKKHFEETDLPELMKQFQARSWRELDQALRRRGTSLEREQRSFVERMVAHQWLRQQVNMDEEVPFDELMAYYNTNLKQFDRPARTTYDELIVSFSKYPSKQEALAAIAAMGNRILDGEDFAAVARSGSDGPTAGEGGRRIWPDETRSVSATVRQAIEGLPLNRLSPILEDWRGYYIIRVVERKPAGLVPFAEAQHEIREKLKRERTNRRLAEYLERIRAQTPVWTIFDAAASPGRS